MYQENVVLCGASSYEEKYYFNEDFSALPASVQDELKILCVLFVSEIGGVLTLEFEEDGSLVFQVSSKEDDFFFDEIGSGLKIKEKHFIKQLQRSEQFFFLSLHFLDEEMDYEE